MNEHMLNNPATVRNIRQLHHDGALFVDSGYGFWRKAIQVKAEWLSRNKFLPR